MKRRDALFGVAAGSMAMAAGGLLPARGAAAGGGSAHPQERISILDFGADPSGSQPCDEALSRAIASVGIGGNDNSIGGPRVHFPPGTYRFAKTIELKRSVILEGDAVAPGGGHTSILVFPANTTGIIVQRYNTIGAGIENPTTKGGDGSIIRNLQLIGSRNGSASGHGIWLRARATIEHVNIREFREHGIQVLAAARTDREDAQGNANTFFIGHCTIVLNDGCGMFVDGADVNAGMVMNTSSSHNGAWGFFDSSFLGNTYIACHTAGNGLHGQVSDGTNRYFLLDDARGGTTKPGTNPDVWEFFKPGPANNFFPLWTQGGTYRTGGSYKSDNRNARNLFIGCYSESGQGLPDIRAPAMAVGGALSRLRSTANGFVISGSKDGGRLGAFIMEQETAASRRMTAAFAVHPEQPMSLMVEGDHPRGFAPLAWDEAMGQWIVQHANNDAHAPVRYTTNLNKATFGRGSALSGGNVAFARGVWLGGTLESARYLGNGIAPPKTGEYAVGDRVFNSVPAVGKPKSWVCVAAGSPGTWVSEGNL